MDSKLPNRFVNRKRKNNLNNQELQDDYFSKRGLQTNNFVVQSKVNCKNLGGVRRLRTSKIIGRLFKILFIRKL